MLSLHCCCCRAASVIVAGVMRHGRFRCAGLMTSCLAARGRCRHCRASMRPLCGCPRLKQRGAAQAVAALLQKDPSAIVALKKSGLARPRDLDGKVRI